MKLPAWMRRALWATTLLNIGAALAFAPLTDYPRQLAGMPTATHPFYLWIVAEFVLLFGVGYGWCAYSGAAPPMFIALAAAGKAGFVAIVTAAWLHDDVPLRAVIAGSPDLAFAALFVAWLRNSRK